MLKNRIAGPGLLCMSLFFLTTTLYAQSEYYRFEKPGRKFSISYPVSWETDEREFPEMYYFEAVDRETGININMTVASDQGAGLADWYAMIGSELRNEPGAEVLYSDVIALNGHQCSLFMTLRNNGNYDVLTNNYVILYSGSAYMFNFTSPGFLYEQYQPVEAEIIGSLLIK